MKSVLILLFSWAKWPDNHKFDGENPVKTAGQDKPMLGLVVEDEVVVDNDELKSQAFNAPAQPKITTNKACLPTIPRVVEQNLPRKASNESVTP